MPRKHEIPGRGCASQAQRRRNNVADMWSENDRHRREQNPQPKYGRVRHQVYAIGYVEAIGEERIVQFDEAASRMREHELEKLGVTRVNSRNSCIQVEPQLHRYANTSNQKRPHSD